MFTPARTAGKWVIMAGLAAALGLPAVSYARNEIMSELQLVGAGDVEQLSGVWIDGQYLGYLKELKGSKKLILMPGKHELVVRQNGYKDFTTTLVLEPGQKQTFRVAMERDATAKYPDVTAEIKLDVDPDRAAVFIDNSFVGHVDEFDGPGQALLVAPGKRVVKITLPGYQTFETEVTLRPNQKFELKTDLAKGSILQAGPLVTSEAR